MKMSQQKKIEVLKDDTDHYRFQLKSNTGNTLFQSIPFDREDDIQKTVGLLHQDIQRHFRFERKTDYAGKFQFHLKNNTGQTIGQSNSYTSEAGMENGIKNLIKSITETKWL